MTVVNFRIDDRLIHGQVVVGWGKPLGLTLLVLVNDEVAANDWEQELYRMAVPSEMEVHFHATDDAIRALPTYHADSRPGMVLTGDIQTMRLLAAAGVVDAVTIGGIHHRVGRVQRLRYVFLTEDEERQLESIASLGISVTAQDVPNARPIPLRELLAEVAT